MIKVALVKHDRSRHDTESKRFDFFDRFLDEWPEVFRRPVVLWPERASLGVEEFTEKGMLVLRVEFAGIDPENDLEVSIENDVLHIAAERRARRAPRSGTTCAGSCATGLFHRDLALPKGTNEADVTATYTDGILEVRVPAPSEAPSSGSVRVPIRSELTLALGRRVEFDVNVPG